MKKELIGINNLGDFVGVHNANMNWVDKCFKNQATFNKKCRLAMFAMAAYIICNDIKSKKQELRISELEKKLDECTIPKVTVKEGE